MTIVLKDGAGKYDAPRRQDARRGTNRWAKRADDDTIYQITSYAADWADRRRVEVRRRRPTPARLGSPDGGMKLSQRFKK